MDDNETDLTLQKGKLVSIKRKEKLTPAQQALAKLPEIEEYLKGKGKGTSYVIVITEDTRLGIGIDNPAEYVGVLTMDLFEYMDSLGNPDEAA